MLDISIVKFCMCTNVTMYACANMLKICRIHTRNKCTKILFALPYNRSTNEWQLRPFLRFALHTRPAHNPVTISSCVSVPHFSTSKANKEKKRAQRGDEEKTREVGNERLTLSWLKFQAWDQCRSEWLAQACTKEPSSWSKVVNH